jgi:hypothetical protein
MDRALTSEAMCSSFRLEFVFFEKTVAYMDSRDQKTLF